MAMFNSFVYVYQRLWLVGYPDGQAQADVLHQDRRGKRVVQHAVHSATRQLLQRAALQGGD